MPSCDGANCGACSSSNHTDGEYNNVVEQLSDTSEKLKKALAENKRLKRIQAGRKKKPSKTAARIDSQRSQKKGGRKR